MGEGSDTALYVRASDRAAAINADIAARHDAERLVYASPCPRCGKHHPKVVAWSKLERKKAARRRVMRIASTAVASLGAAIFIPLFLWIGITTLIHMENRREAISGLGLIGFGVPLLGYMPWAMWREMKPVRPNWSVFKRQSKNVEFLKEDPYRGAQPLTGP